MPRILVVRIWCALLLSLFFPILGQPPTPIEVRFSASPEVAKTGEHTRLRWQVQNADTVYVSGLGQVASNGDQYVNPESPTVYTLFAEGTTGLVSKKATITAPFEKKGEFAADLDRFRYPLKTDCSATFTKQLGKIHHVLQDEMGFSLQESEVVDTTVPAIQLHFRFLTNASERTLNQEREPTIGARRISYLIDVEASSIPPRACTYIVRTLIEYRRRIEATWRIEGREILYIEQGRALRKRIDDPRDRL